MTTTTANTAFEQWWKRQTEINAAGLLKMTAKQIARHSFEHGMSIGGNYVADDVEMPESVSFENGRVVRIVDNETPGVREGVYLTVSWKLPFWDVSVAV